MAATARSTPERWRLHSTLIGADEAFLRHAQRRAAPLRATPEGHFEFHRTNHSKDDLGHPVFDLLIRWVPTEREH